MSERKQKFLELAGGFYDLFLSGQNGMEAVKTLAESFPDNLPDEPNTAKVVPEHQEMMPDPSTLTMKQLVDRHVIFSTKKKNADAEWMNVNEVIEALHELYGEEFDIKPRKLGQALEAEAEHVKRGKGGRNFLILEIVVDTADYEGVRVTNEDELEDVQDDDDEEFDEEEDESTEEAGEFEDEDEEEDEEDDDDVLPKLSWKDIKKMDYDDLDEVIDDYEIDLDIDDYDEEDDMKKLRKDVAKELGIKRK